ncbi:hypothetical protein BOX15_Mlig009685g1, partial [Macrostomum lignano]
RKMAGKGVPTVDQLESDVIMRIGQQYWIGRDEASIDFKQQVVDAIYSQEIRHSQFAQRRIMMLEFFRYLEQYLWPFYSPATATDSFVLSIACMVNEKRRERVPVWPAFVEKPEHFGHLVRQTLRLALDADNQLSVKEHIVLVDFIGHCLTSLEVDLVRDQLKRTISLGIWRCLSPRRLQLTLDSQPRLAKLYRALLRRDEKTAPTLSQSERDFIQFEYTFLASFIERFVGVLYSIKPASIDGAELKSADRLTISYCERCLQLLIDLESTLLTRRFFNLLLDDRNVVVRCKLAPLAGAAESDGKLFCQLLSMLEFYARFEIDELEGQPLTSVQVDSRHCKDIVDLQKSVYRLHRENLADLQRRFVVANVGSLESELELCRFLDKFDMPDLLAVAEHLGLRVEHSESGESEQRRLITALMVYRFCKRKSQLDTINSMSLYPTEQIIWDENIVPVERYYGDGCLALPKLNLQFLTLHDYLMRNFHLFRLESTYEIRQDVEDAVARLRPCQGDMGEDEVVFSGWSRMALPIQSFNIIEVAKPLLGSSQPSKVRADVSVMLAYRHDVVKEWDTLRRHDPCFLITVRPTCPRGTKFDYKAPFVPQVGLTCVRGCELEGLLDEEGKIIPEEQMHQMRPQGRHRTYRVRLDPCQYQTDMERVSEGSGEDVYSSFNVLLRRKPKENNFKAVLETIRNLMNTKCVVPDWLLDLLLGYEDPGSANFINRPDAYLPEQDWRDTFLDQDHLAASFPQFELEWTTTDSSSEQSDSDSSREPPYRLIFPTLEAEVASQPEAKPVLKALPYRPPRRGPYKSAQYKRNAVRFTPTQVRAIRSGMQPGLTLVVGPPGSGKTDVAVQIIANIYHNYPHQRTLLVTHSNQALNQLFEKIMALDIDQRHLLRLGRGEEALDTEGDFSRHGRVNYILARRVQLLQEVGRLAESLGMPLDQAADSCEQAEYFFMYHVLDRWEAFLHRINTETVSNADSSAAAALVSQHFPFHGYFANADYLPLFKGDSLEADMDSARACFRHLESLFQQLSEFRSFEHMRSGVERANYLLVQEAKIIALTCTHASLRRQDLVQLSFHYDNIVMEESAQILEIETFIPLLLQNPDYQGNSTLKRWIMIGDHHQLPPVVKNMAFQKYSNMEQSLFTRLIKLGVPAVQLDAQGRARSSIAELYRWRYTRLADLPHVLLQPEFRFCNPGFEFDYQLVDVADFNGVGESEPNPHFFQNLGEAEYAVAIFMYMRLIGWPAEKITILTTYNGQKHLLRDIVNSKCADNALLGRPSKVTTVDRYQGQQNDFVILSLVRTKAVGHVRDIRRLVVALSRARLGLIVLARESLFRNCFELRPAFDLLSKRPSQLRLLPWESFSVPRPINSRPARQPVSVVDVFQAVRIVQELHQARLRTMALSQPPQAPRPPSPPPMPPRLPEGAVQAYSSGSAEASESQPANAEVEVLEADDVELIEEVGVDTQTGTEEGHHVASYQSDEENEAAEDEANIVEGYSKESAATKSNESNIAKGYAQNKPATDGESEVTRIAEGKSKETPAAEGESEETPAAEGESEEAPAAEEEFKETPVAEGESKETPVAEGESKETPVAEGESEENPVAEGESEETPATGKETEQTTVATEKSKKTPTSRRRSKRASAVQEESEEAQTAEAESKEATKEESEVTPAVEEESGEATVAKGKSKKTPAARRSKRASATEEETGKAAVGEKESQETPAAEGESQEEIPTVEGESQETPVAKKKTPKSKKTPASRRRSKRNSATEEASVTEEESQEASTAGGESEETTVAKKTPTTRRRSKRTSAAEEPEETPVAEGESQETPIGKGKSQQTRSSKRSKRTSAAEEESEDTPDVKRKSEKAPITRRQSRRISTAESEETPVAEGESEEIPTDEVESEETSSTKGSSRKAPVARRRSKRTPAAQEEESVGTPASEGESEEAPVATRRSKRAPAATRKSRKAAADAADSSAVSVEADSAEEAETPAEQPPAKRRRSRRRRN